MIVVAAGLETSRNEMVLAIAYVPSQLATYEDIFRANLFIVHIPGLFSWNDSNFDNFRNSLSQLQQRRSLSIKWTRFLCEQAKLHNHVYIFNSAQELIRSFTFTHPKT